MNKIPVWIDCDTGVDDALALIVACSLKQLDILGISTVAGNATLEYTFKNTRDVLSLVNREDIKVYKGCDKPLVRALRTGEKAHGKDGLGGAIIDTSKAEIEKEKAIDALYKKALELNDQLIICTLGPLTNIATAIIKHPDIVDHIKEINMMGGAIEIGNVTPSAEFNIYVDPEAALTVFKSGIKVNMFGLDVTRKAYLDDDDIQEIASYNNKLSKLFVDSNHLLYEAKERLDKDGLCEHDACPIIYTAYNDYCEGYECGIYVETRGLLTTGKTVCDLYSDYKFADRHNKVFINLDREKFVKLIKDAYKVC